MNKLMILDGNSIVNRAFYGVRPLNAPDGTPTNAVYGFLAILQKLLDGEAPDSLCVAFDLPAPTFRHDMFEGYKAQRKPMPDDLAVQMPLLKETLDAMHIRRLEAAGLGGGRRARLRRGKVRKVRLGVRDSHRRQGQLPAHHRHDQRAARQDPHGPDGDDTLRQGALYRGIRLCPAAHGGPQGPDGRRLGQHPRRARHRRKDRPRPRAPLRHRGEHLREPRRRWTSGTASAKSSTRAARAQRCPIPSPP